MVETFDIKTKTYVAPETPLLTAFDWHLHPREMPLPQDAKDKLPLPFLSPLLPSSVFAISRLHFKNLHSHDPAIKTWAAARFELSLKVSQESTKY
ncbi:hypothetical protein SK128_012434 [Halocaridina rubra]|uniref:Uncharacterized protein n=1 Tax=Halocaridina rubra TaxID=373956 RepID=A0AAN8WJL4_HALRR